MSPTTHLTLLAVAWGLYGLLHSALASPRTKAWFASRFPRRFRSYRLMFNIAASALLIPPLWLLVSYPGEALWRWPRAVGWLADAAALAAAAGFLWTLKIYDTGEFLGIRQLRQPAAQPPGERFALDKSPMRLSWVHRYVRHPWYFLGLVIIWTREMDAALLVTAVVLTLYVVLGSRREEHDLITRYGEQYRAYRERVPGLIPRPWRYLTKEQAERLRRMDGAP